MFTRLASETCENGSEATKPEREQMTTIEYRGRRITLNAASPARRARTPCQWYKSLNHGKCPTYSDGDKLECAHCPFGGSKRMSRTKFEAGLKTIREVGDE